MTRLGRSRPAGVGATSFGATGRNLQGLRGVEGRSCSDRTQERAAGSRSRPGEVHGAALGHPAAMEQLGGMLHEELIAPQALIAERSRTPDALRFADAEILAHLLRPALVEGAVDGMLRAAV